MTISSQQRKPRYKRVKDAFNLRLQKRDDEIIRQVFRHRFLSSEQIAALIGGSRQLILRRLQKLFHAGYLDRPPDQIRPYKSGSDHMAYALGNAGAKLLVEKFNIPAEKFNWTNKNREVKIRFLEHTLQTSQFMVCLELACRDRKDVALITPGNVLKQMKEEARKRISPFSWNVSAKIDTKGEKIIHTFGMIPDKVLGLYFPDRPQGKNRTFFFLEADQGTMPIKSANMHRSSFFKKMLGYFHSWDQGLFEKTFPFKSARVLTVTKSEERIKNMVAAGLEIDPKRKGHRMFLFIPESQLSLKEPGKILEKAWTDGRGETVGLFE